MTTSGDKAQDVAHFFLSKIDVESGEVITHLKLQKLIYYAQAWFLAFFARPLFHDSFEAWQHGPVVRKLYFHYKDFGFNPLPKVDVLAKNAFTAEEIYSPQSQKLKLGSMVERYVISAITKTTHPRTVFHCLKVQFFIRKMK